MALSTDYGVLNITYDSMYSYATFSSTAKIPIFTGNGSFRGANDDSPQGCIDFLNATLVPAEDGGPLGARHQPKKPAAARSRGKRAVNAKKLGGKKSTSINEGYYRWEVDRVVAPVSYYQQLAVQGLESSPATKYARFGDIAGSL